MLEYRVGDATLVDPTAGPTIIAHICNDQGGWGMGFVRALSARWPEAEAAYRQLDRQGGLLLGHVQFVSVGMRVVVANMIAQRKYKNAENPVPLRMWALRECLQRLAVYARVGQCCVQMPKIGTGLGGGNWDEIENLIIDCLCIRGVAVTVYTLEETV